MEHDLPMIASLTLVATGRMFFSTSSKGPGRWASFSFRSSASRALFNLSCVACSDGSATVSVYTKHTVSKRAKFQQTTEQIALHWFRLWTSMWSLSLVSSLISLFRLEISFYIIYKLYCGVPALFTRRSIINTYVAELIIKPLWLCQLWQNKWWLG